MLFSDIGIQKLLFLQTCFFDKLFLLKLLYVEEICYQNGETLSKKVTIIR